MVEVSAAGVANSNVPLEGSHARRDSRARAAFGTIRHQAVQSRNAQPPNHPMTDDVIRIRGARQNNLQNLTSTCRCTS